MPLHAAAEDPHPINFSALLQQIGIPGLFLHPYPFAHDGFGNYWTVDVIASEEQKAQVLFACHDPPVVVYQSDGLAHFLEDVVQLYSSPGVSELGEHLEWRAFEIWRHNPNVLSVPEAAASADDALRAFGESIPPDAGIIDLRTFTPRIGFSWGRYGGETELVRYGQARLFAYWRRPRRPGLLSRLRQKLSR